MCEIPESRQAVVLAAFQKHDHEGKGCVEAADLKGSYAAHIHPKVVSGELSEDEVFLEFLTHFEDRDRDGRIHWDEWCKYYAGVSERVGSDEHFSQLMCQVWRM